MPSNSARNSSVFQATNATLRATCDAQCADDSAIVLPTDPETGVASGCPEAAICVQDVDVQCVLQFTLIHAAGCALHRHTSRVIHRLEFSLLQRRIHVTLLLLAERGMRSEKRETTADARAAAM